MFGESALQIRSVMYFDVDEVKNKNKIVIKFPSIAAYSLYTLLVSFSLDAALFPIYIYTISS